ncbi:hypothetical protein ACFQ9V_00915 [Leifsonia sp. NPDC056665]|uniref:hypothetical protein n=1 Tax=Leifsonia sp. NPDC056665 TaxID=3345901 RepID=UPI0036876497
MDTDIQNDASTASGGSGGEWGSGAGVLLLRALASTDGYVPRVDTDGLIIIETPGALTCLETGHPFSRADLERPDPYRELFDAARREHQSALEERLETLMFSLDASGSDLLIRFYKEPEACYCANHAPSYCAPPPSDSRSAATEEKSGWAGRVTVRISESDGHTLIRANDARANVDLADTTVDLTDWMDELISAVQSARDHVDFS